MKLRCLAIALTFLATIASDYRAQSQRQPPRQDTKGTQHNPNAGNRGTEQTPFVIKVLPSEQTKENPDSTKTEGPRSWSDRLSLSDKIAILASGVAFLQFLVLLATVYVMRRTAQRQLRAYVCLFGGSITLRKVEQQTFIEGYVSLKNFG